MTAAGLPGGHENAEDRRHLACSGSSSSSSPTSRPTARSSICSLVAVSLTPRRLASEEYGSRRSRRSPSWLGHAPRGRRTCRSPAGGRSRRCPRAAGARSAASRATRRASAPPHARAGAGRRAGGDRGRASCAEPAPRCRPAMAAAPVHPKIAGCARQRIAPLSQHPGACKPPLHGGHSVTADQER